MKRFRIVVGNSVYSAAVERLGVGRYRVKLGDKVAEVSVEEETPKITSVRKETAPATPALKVEKELQKPVAVSGAVTAMLPGVVLKILVSLGDTVKAGQPIMVLEAMKMENEIVSPVDGVVQEIMVKEGDKVETGDLLAVVQ
jgi:oxaloacetate decarboxylase alpha subunit